jgi:hypothetical protein
VIDYWLGSDTHGPVTLEVYNFKGELVRRFSSADVPRHIRADRYFAKEWLKPARPLSAAPGMHRFVWNLRYARPHAISYDYGMAAVFGEDTPTAVQGPLVLPGIYSIVLTAGDQQYRAPLIVQLDPRVHTSAADLRALLTYSQSLCALLERAATVDEGEKPASEQLGALVRRLTAGHEDHSLLREIQKLRDATAAGEKALGRISGTVSGLEADAESADLAPTAADQQVLDKESKALDEAERAWSDSQAAIRKLDVRLRHAGLPAVVASN